MVSFQIMSDLHIETHIGNPDVEDYITPSAQILILAGDIGRAHRFEQLQTFLEKVCARFKTVLYVLGNHEYYRVDGIPPRPMEVVLQDIQNLQKSIPNLYILNRNCMIFDNVCIVGCTLWSNASIDTPPFIVRIPNMNIAKYNSLHRKDLAYIESLISYCKKNGLKLVVVTHHAPTFRVGSRRKGDRYKSLYCSHLDRLLDSGKVHTWICGHTHRNFDFKTELGTRLVSNQKGKPKDRITDFVKIKVISV